MIEISLKFNTVAEAAAALNQLNGKQLAAATITETAAPATKSTKTTKAEVAAPAPAEPPASAPVPAAPKVDYPTLQKAVFKLAGVVKAKGLDTDEHVLSIAKAHGGNTFKEVPAENWAAALVAVEASIVKVEALEAEVA